MRKNQKGFGHLEALIVLVVIILVAAAGYYVAKTKNTDIVKCGSQSCLNQKFAACNPATYSASSGSTLLGSVKYQIYGKKGSSCSMLFEYTANPNSDWVNKPMTCDFDNSKSLDEAVSAAFSSPSMYKCTGPLVSILKSSGPITPLSSSSNSSSNSSISRGNKVVTVPMGQSATDSSGLFTIKVLNVILNPSYTGAKPDAGTQYLEVDISATQNIAGGGNVCPSYIPSPSNPNYNNAVSEELGYLPIDSSSGTDSSPDSSTNPINNDFNDGKKVQISGKTSFANGLDNSNSQLPFTSTGYCLYEIADGDKGSLVYDFGFNPTYIMEIQY